MAHLSTAVHTLGKPQGYSFPHTGPIERQPHDFLKFQEIFLFRVFLQSVSCAVPETDTSVLFQACRIVVNGFK